MAMTRQYGNSGTRKMGTIIFSPANPQINVSMLPESGDFSIHLRAHVKDSFGYAVANERISFQLFNVPSWLSTANAVYETTDANGSLIIEIYGKILKSYQETHNVGIPFTLYAEHSKQDVSGILQITHT